MEYSISAHYNGKFILPDFSLVLPVSIKPLLAADAPKVYSLTWRYYHPLLHAIETDLPSIVRPCALVAWVDELPVGLILSAAADDHRVEAGQQRVLSLMVSPAWRRRGIARQLLAALEEQREKLALRGISISYSDRLPGAPALARLLPSLGWSDVQPQRLRICGEGRQTGVIFRNQTALLRRLERHGLRICAWRERAEAAEALAGRCIAEEKAPMWTSPAMWAERLDPDLSLILLDKTDTAVGWVICEYQAAMARWHYPVGWVVPPYDTQGWLLVAYADGARRLVERHGETAVAVIETGSEQHGMWTVLEKHFKPHVTWTDRLMYSERRFDASAQ
ncbi:GNAT family N-acetyltransferase [Azonexus sp.]|uniref:GNAT family N-acetyltransferase n=1 Tax=Azonexus sp. TaxID=1872668 RepID=UPI0027B91D70|nr:GNAT family N-acetyltransferase [Azonexus sp.]